MCQWEMACEDFFSTSKKLEVIDRVSTILPGLKDLCTRDWVATHHADLVALPFDDFMVELCREFLPEGWDDDLHAKICSSCLKSSDSFMSWVNEIRHLNIILWGTDYHFKDDPLHLQLDSLIDSDLRARVKNRWVKEIVEAAVNTKGKKTAKAHLTIWISEMRKLTEEHFNNTKHYRKAAESFHRAGKRCLTTMGITLPNDLHLLALLVL